MSKYVCIMCGEIYDEEAEGVRFEDLPDDWCCPTCGSDKSCFELMAEDSGAGSSPAPKAESSPAPRAGPSWNELIRRDGGVMDSIHAMAESGKSEDAAMETLVPVPDFSSILILGGQLAHPPKDDAADVDIGTVIGSDAERPMLLDMPVFVSHMSFGALSKTAKVALAKGSAEARTAMCSGEGGVLPEEMRFSYRYIYEYPPNGYSFTDEVMEGSAAIEIKIGQGTKPGMGGHLPGAKVTPEIAAMRGKPVGEDIHSPSRFPGIETPEDLKALVDMLRKRGKGIPVGVKIAAGRIEDDLEFISHSGCDFITIDGRGGATGSSPRFLRDATSVPTVYALIRARKYMDEHGMTQSLIMTGGFRTSADVVKAIAMGADAVAMASAPLMALGCQRYRACTGGKCPMGIATQDPVLESRLDGDAGAARVANFLKALAGEIRTFVRVTGHDSVTEFSAEDLCTTDASIAEASGIRHA